MQSFPVVNRDFFPGLNVSERKENQMAAKRSGEAVWRARMIDVVSSIAATAAVQTPPVIDSADAQNAPACAATGFSV
jgi:hypothetical protein